MNDIAKRSSSREDKGARYGVVGPSLWFSLCSKHTMNRLFDKKSKDSRKSSQRLLSLGIPTNVAIGPLGFRAELDIGPKGERNRPDRDLRQMGLIRPWCQMKRTPGLRGSRFRKIRTKIEDLPPQKSRRPSPWSVLPSTGTTLQVSASGLYHRSRCSSGPALPRQKNTPGTLERKEVDRKRHQGVCDDTSVFYFLLTPTRSGEGHGARDNFRLHSCRKGDPRRIRSSQCYPGGHFRRLC